MPRKILRMSIVSDCFIRVRALTLSGLTFRPCGVNLCPKKLQSWDLHFVVIKDMLFI